MSDGANIVPLPRPAVEFSFAVLAALGSIVALSVAMFVALTRRWTTDRRRGDVADWARSRGFALSDRETSAPPPFDAPAAAGRAELRAATCLRDEHTALILLEAAEPLGGRAAPAPSPPPSPAIVAPAALSSPPPPTPVRHWHVLVRTVESEWPPTGLRPASAAASLLDVFPLASFPLMGPTDRFVVYGTDSAPARRLHKSHVRALLPPDVGVLLYGRHLVLDFTNRPFDTIEFGRMIALADQIVAHLPIRE